MEYVHTLVYINNHKARKTDRYREYIHEQMGETNIKTAIKSNHYVWTATTMVNYYTPVCLSSQGMC